MMAPNWSQSLSRWGLIAGVAAIGIAAASTLYLVLSTFDLLDETIVLAIVGGGFLTAVTGVAVYGYTRTDGG